jgi:hypothetical protein
MKRIAITVLTGVFAVLMPVSVLAQATSNHEKGSFPISTTEFVPCANNGLGELISIAGTIYYETTYTTDGNGGLHMEELVHPLNSVTVVGQTSGTQYKATGGAGHTTLNVSSTGFPFETTFTLERPFIGASAGYIFLRILQRVTIDSNGDIHAEIDKANYFCR